VLVAIFNADTVVGESPASPREVVEKYCWLDAQGANFSSSNPRFKAIGNLLINEDEAAYDSSVVVSSYRVNKATIDKNTATVLVIYQDLGMLSGGQLERKKEEESVVFHLSRIGRDWKIDGLRIFPHISKTWVLSEMGKGLIADGASSSNLVKEINQR
jgi:hypothetical protein